MNFEERFNELIKKDNTHEKDFERRSMFYVLAGSETLYNKVNHFYDFDDHSINPDCLEGGISLSHGELMLVTLAYSHYNSFPADVHEVLYALDDDELTLAMNSIKFRYARKGNPSW